MQSIESVLFENCQDRELPTEQEIREQMFDEIDQLIGTIFAEDGSNARIKPHYAVSLLYRYAQITSRLRMILKNVIILFLIKLVAQSNILTPKLSF